MATIRELIEGKELPVRVTLRGSDNCEVILKAKETCVLKREDGEYVSFSLNSGDWSLYEDQKKKTVLHEYLIKRQDYLGGAYFIELFESDELFKKWWRNNPIIKTGRTVEVEL